MKCQNPKCKDIKLQTKRTFENGLTTTREKYCPKCHDRPMTIELMQAELDKVHSDHAAQVEALRRKIDLTEDRLSEVKHSIVTVLEFATEKKKEAKRQR